MKGDRTKIEIPLSLLVIILTFLLQKLIEWEFCYLHSTLFGQTEHKGFFQMITFETYEKHV
jgi:hypothetical protein